jgi:hypothetical protein
MSYQLELTFEDKLTPEEYDRLNPDIWNLFVKYAFRIIRRGQEHYGAKAIFELIRYHSIVRGTGTFKVNNNYTSYYARKFHKEYPMYDGFFETRRADVKV